MATSKTTTTQQDRPDPLAHVNMILDAESPAPRMEQTVPTVMEQSKKLSEMMDSITDPSEFGTLHHEIEAEMAKIATEGTEAERAKVAAQAQSKPTPEPVKLPSFDAPSRAIPKGPKEAGVPEYDVRPGGRRARSKASAPAPVSLPTGATPTGQTTQLTGEHVASLLKMTHAIGATVLGPTFSIPDESAKAIGDAALPVLEDFGIAVASRAVHLMMLVSTVAMIEGPIILTTMESMRRKAQMERGGYSAMAMGSDTMTEEDIAAAVSAATGVVVG